MREWADLPGELLILILSNLFAKDRLIFRSVCRSWNAAAVSSPYHSPCLIFYERSNPTWKFYQYNGFFYIDFPKLPQAKIRCCKYGWLLMSEYNNCNSFFFDPFNYERIDLPKSDYDYTVMSFFHQPTSPDCVIVGMKNSRSHLSVRIGVLNRGEDKWKINTYNHKVRRFYLSMRTPVVHHGQLYCLDPAGDIAICDINKQGCETSRIVENKCPGPICIRSKPEEYFLFKVGELLFVVLVNHDERKVDVFRLLEPELNWECVEDLEDKMLFVSHAACFAQTAPRKSMGNKIYFPEFETGNGAFYSLETQKYHSFEDDYSNIKSYGFKDNFATWIVPCFRGTSADLSWCTNMDMRI